MISGRGKPANAVNGSNVKVEGNATSRAIKTYRFRMLY